uniref:NADH-ubiquinone oxidoreductase chain 3 n=1 Tax=Pneumocystis canis TaxID=2698477 RepID=A0A8A6W4V9_9ASCO|nr:NADH dehydrogenase subunit 3 [Pneumocystis canis]QTK22340.1 NADH dehydrogenase subunit 3 [Pneumocystis canis]QTK22370.1 NADH dehydrogenase subunit 3 [Pneumocystis canis]
MGNSMTIIQVLILVVVVLSVLLLVLNILFAKTSPTLDKIAPFECGLSSFSQTRNPFYIYYYLIGLLFLVFDLEILLIYPFAIGSSIYGFYILNIFLIILTIGFIYELGKGVLNC